MSDDLSTTLSNILLCCTASHGMFSSTRGGVCVNPGMHGNFFVFGVLGIINTKCLIASTKVEKDIGFHYEISRKATRFLSLACLNADLYSFNLNVSGFHLISGLLTFLISAQLEDEDHLANLCLSVNVLSLVYYSFKKKQTWGFYTAGAAMMGFLGTKCTVSFLYPLSLSVMELCVAKLMIDVNRMENEDERPPDSEPSTSGSGKKR